MDMSVNSQSVENPIPSNDVQPVETSTVAEPQPPAIPAEPSAGPPAREISVLEALLDGADPATLFANKQPAPAQTEPPEQDTQVQPPVQPEPAQDGTPIPDKFKNPDGSLNSEAVLKSYTELEKAYGDQGNKMGQMGQQFQAQIQELRALIEQGQSPAQQAQPEGPLAQPEISPEQVAEFNQKWLDTFYEKGPLAVLDLINNALPNMMKPFMEKIEPVLQRDAYNQQVESYNTQIKTMSEKYPDFGQIIPDIQAVVQENPHLENMPNGLEIAYGMAKGRQADALKAQIRTPEQMLADPDFKKLIMSNPEIVNEIRKGYAQDIAKGAPPVVIGANPGGIPPATPGERPRSAGEAGKLFARSLNTQ